MGNNPTTLILFGAIAVVLIFLMFRNSRRNKARQEQIKTEMVPGAEIMTNFGLFGKLLSVDEVSNEAVIETSPGVTVRVHRQTLSKVVTAETVDPDAPASTTPRSVEEAMEIANREEAEREAAAKIDAQAPEYGERVDDPITKATTKRAPRAPKKSDD